MHIHSSNSSILAGICALLINDVLLHMKVAIEEEFHLIRFHSMGEYDQLIFYKTYNSVLSIHVDQENFLVTLPCVVNPLKVAK